MSKSTISTFQLFEMFPDQETARVYLESRLWPNGPRCPVCGLGERITARKDGYYRCNQCKEDFTVRTGTIFERSTFRCTSGFTRCTCSSPRARVFRPCSSPRKSASRKSRLGSSCTGFARRAAGSREACKASLRLTRRYIGGNEKNKHEAKKLRPVVARSARRRSWYARAGRPNVSPSRSADRQRNDPQRDDAAMLWPVR